MLLKDIWNYRQVIYRMSIIDTKSFFKGSVLSYIWVFINPLLMIGVYLFSFYAAGDNFVTIQLTSYNYNDCISTANNYLEYSKIGWLIIGVLSWNFFGSVVIHGSNSIRYYSWMVTKIGTPLCVPPMFVTLSKALVGFFCIITSWFIYMIIAGVDKSYNEPVISLTILQLPLMLILSFVFLSLWSLIFSPFVAISKDIFNILTILPVFLQWITGVFLPLNQSNFNDPIGIIFRINPFNFLIDNIRSSIMGNAFFWNDWVSMVSFFSFLILFIVIAIIINKRAKKVVVDLA